MRASNVAIRDGKTVYWDENPCEGTYADGRACDKKARYTVPSGDIRCGIHSGSKVEKKSRRELVRNPKARQNKDADASRVTQLADGVARQRMAEAKKTGVLPPPPIVRGDKIFKGREGSFVPVAGYAPIFPNHRHSHGFNYGFGDYSHMSPMKLGPVLHGQKGVIAAKSIENYHQYNKVYPEEVVVNGAPLCQCGRNWPHAAPSPEFYKLRDLGYADPVPHRHKLFMEDHLPSPEEEPLASTTDKKRARPAKKKKRTDLPLYSVHVGADGKERHFTYIESRYFYCHQMENFLRRGGGLNGNAFRGLCSYRDRGYNISIIGYDAHNPDALDADTIYKHYCDPDKPFGHELVIIALLLFVKDQPLFDTIPELPWNRYYAEHRAIYE